jgi:hypothetical protein
VLFPNFSIWSVSELILQDSAGSYVKFLRHRDLTSSVNFSACLAFMKTLAWTAIKCYFSSELT